MRPEPVPPMSTGMRRLVRMVVLLASVAATSTIVDHGEIDAYGYAYQAFPWWGYVAIWGVVAGMGVTILAGMEPKRAWWRPAFLALFCIPQVLFAFSIAKFGWDQGFWGAAKGTMQWLDILVFVVAVLWDRGEKPWGSGG